MQNGNENSGNCPIDQKTRMRLHRQEMLRKMKEDLERYAQERNEANTAYRNYERELQDENSTLRQPHGQYDDDERTSDF